MEWLKNQWWIKSYKQEKKSYVAKVRINTVVNNASQEKMEWYEKMEWHLWSTERQNLRNLEVYTHWKIL